MLSRHSFLFLAAILLLTGHPGRGATSLATQPSLTFFTSLSEEPLGRLEAASIAPRSTRHGPFRMPAPGVEIESPTLILHDQPCTAEDWQRVLTSLASWRRLSSSTAFVLTLPDDRSFAFLRPPSVGGGGLSGIVRPLNPQAHEPASPPRAALLRVRHDGASGLRIDVRPLPSTNERVMLEPPPSDLPAASSAPVETTATASESSS